MCIHLKRIEDYLLSKGFKEVYRGKVWSKNCREWIYFNTVLQPKELIVQFNLDNTIEVHDYQDMKVGSELGLVCTQCHDALMGYHPNPYYEKNILNP